MRTDFSADQSPSLRDSAQPLLSIIINPGSGEHDLEQTREQLARVFDEAGRRYEFVPVESPQALGEASREAAAIAARSGSVLVAVGGDGTINTVAQAAWLAGCVLGIIPQGTFNFFGRGHGIPQELEAAARALVMGRQEPVQVGEVNGRLFLVNASLGLYPQLLEDRETSKKQWGRYRWVAMLSGIKTMLEWRRRMTLEIDLDGQRSVIVTPTLFVGNNRLQLEKIGVEPATAGRVGEGRLAAIATLPVGSWRMLWLLLHGALGRLREAPQVHSFAFRTLTVRVPSMRKLKVAADGEVGVMKPPLSFCVSPKPLLLLLPRPEDRVAIE